MNASAGPLLELLLAREPENPEVLAAAARYHEKLGHEGQAVDARRRLAALKGYEDDARKQEAALWLGEHLSRTDPDLARAYLRRRELLGLHCTVSPASYCASRASA